MIFAILIILLAFGVYLYAKWKFAYWKKRNLPYPEPTFPFGSYGLPTRSFLHPAEIIKKYYDHFKPLGHKHFGLFLMLKPIYVVIDQELIKKIMVIDFEHFHSRGFYSNAKVDPMSASFPFLDGQEWKTRRQEVTPAFSSGKIKSSFPILLQCSDQFVAAITKLSETKNGVNVSKLIDCLTGNFMGVSAFGFESGGYEEKYSELQKYGKQYFLSLSPIQVVKWFIAYYNKALAEFLRITLLPKDVTDFFNNVLNDTVKFRESTKFHRPDLMQHLIDVKNKGLSEAKKNLNYPITNYQQMLADAFALNIVGLESPSSVVNFCLFELAVNPYIQERVRDEIKRVTKNDNGKLTYNNLREMKYLNQVIDETFRKYPSTPLLSRMCTKDYKVPNTDVTIEKGTMTVVPVLGLHYDSEYFPEPERFDPERFSDENKEKIPPFTFLPYGEGPRICIAARFGFVVSKLAVAVMVKNFSFTLNKKISPSQKIDPLNHSYSFQNPILMDIKKLQP